MNKYEEMSDKDINFEVLMAVYGEHIKCWCLSDDETYIYDCGPTGDQFYKLNLDDYCNNPFFGWQIILNNGISIDSPESMGSDEWLASKFYPHGFGHTIEAWHENPLRAAMIVFLMM